MIRAIIIDDEEGGRKALNIALERYFPEVNIVGIYDGAQSGIEGVLSVNPDLVFLDIQMPHMSGFDFLQRLTPFEFEVIFITAYDQYAIRAIRFSALDYLLKPVDIDDLGNALARVSKRLEQKDSQLRYQSVLNNVKHQAGRIERLAIPTHDGIEFFNTEDIIFCQADGSYTLVMMEDSKSELVSHNLKDFENILSGSGFCRVHHSFLINMQHVHKYIKGDGGYVLMTDGHHVDVSRRKKDDFLNLLNKI